MIYVGISFMHLSFKPSGQEKTKPEYKTHPYTMLLNAISHGDVCITSEAVTAAAVAKYRTSTSPSC